MTPLPPIPADLAELQRQHRAPVRDVAPLVSGLVEDAVREAARSRAFWQRPMRRVVNGPRPPRGAELARRAANRGPSASWYRVRNADEGESSARVDIYDEIGWGWFGGVTAADFVAEITALDVEQIDLHINSPGGDVYEGLAILNSLRQHKARVVVTVDGVAASAASFIAMAGDEVIMARNSELMIHEAMGICIGWASDMRDMGDRLDKISNNIASIYADRAGGSVEDWRAAMTAETWYSDQEAVDAGLADRVLSTSDEDAETAKNQHDLSVFAHAGRRNAPAPPVARQTTDPKESRPVAFTDEQMTQLREKLGVADDADEQTILDALDEALEERADDPEDTGTTNVLPEGVVTIDSTVLGELQNRAARGDAARTEQELAARASLVDGAIRDGRITPAGRESWMNLLAQDAGAADTLAGLAKNTVPLEARGHAGNPANDAAGDPAARDDYWFRGSAQPAAGVKG